MFTMGPRPLQPVWQCESWPPGTKRFDTGTIGGRLHLWRKQDPHQSSDSKTLEGIPPELQRQRPSPMVIKETANYDIQITHRAQPAATPYVQQIQNRREWSLCLRSSPAKHWTCVAKLHTPLGSEDWDLANQWHSCPKNIRDQTGADLYHGLHRSIGSHGLTTNLLEERRRRN